jgi:outer membrane receptor protein involved in Fe transport
VNYFSDRIASVGAFGLPDVIEEGRTSLDFVYEFQLSETRDWKIRFEAENITDEKFLWTQGGFTKQFYQPGRSYGVGMSYSFLE